MDLEINKEIILNGTDFAANKNSVELIGITLRDELQLKLVPQAKSLSSFQIDNVLGQHMMMIDSNNSNDITIDVSHLSKVIYYITNTLLKVISLKFLKSS